MDILFLLSSALAISIIFLFIMHHKSSQTSFHPPGPKGLPFIGNLHQVDISKPHVWLQQLSKQYGPIMSFKACRLPVVVFSSAEIATKIFKHNDVAFAGRPYTSSSLRLSYNQSDIMTTTYSDYWRRMRKMVFHNVFSLAKTRSFRPVREQEVALMIAEVSSKANLKQHIDMEKMASCFTCDHVYRIAFGNKLDRGSEEWRRFHMLIRRYWACITETFATDCLKFGWINKVCGVDRRVEQVFEDMDSFCQQLIDSHLSPNRPESMNGDIIDLLIQLKEDDSAAVKIDCKHIKAILMNIFLAGTGAISVTITWAMTALMKKPSAMKKVQQEIRSSVGIKSSIGEEDIEKLTYLKAVIRETLRLYPPVSLVPKETTERSTINGYEIHPKTMVLVNIWVIGRDPECWENPEEFLPERFLNTTTDFKRVDDHGFIPFGMGRRICPGRHLGMAAAELALTNLLYFFNWELPHGTREEDIDTEPSVGIVMHKKNPLFLLPKIYM